MSSKIFRDPLYNYISIDRSKDKWLLDLLDCPEVQRLRRIHQLGVSYLTYPGADHNRLAHSLGVLHLMQQAYQHLEQISDDEETNRGRAPLFAAALIHDVGHGPYSHLFEPCLGVHHEEWSKAIILDEETSIHMVLKKVDRSLPRTVAELIDSRNRKNEGEAVLPNSGATPREDLRMAQELRFRRDEFPDECGFNNQGEFHVYPKER